MNEEEKNKDFITPLVDFKKPKKQGLFKRIKNSLGTKGLIAVGILFLALVALGVFVYVHFYKQSSTPAVNTTNNVVNEQAAVPSTDQSSSLDGMLYTADRAKRAPLGVMIENHPDARPQAGLDKASLIYEAIAEGGITRFLAVFGPNDATKVGPVRSARTYYVEWAEELKAIYAHAGGNIDALDKINSEKNLLYDINGLSSIESSAFDREPKKGVGSEHTLFSSTTNLYNLAKKKGYPTTAQFTGYTFKDDADTAVRGTAQDFTIDFSTPSYFVEWTYNPTTNLYMRKMAGAPHVDKITGTQLSAKNVAVISVVRKNIKSRDGKEVQAFTLTGSGKLTFFQDGKKIDGTWKKDGKNRTQYFDSAGTPISFNRGVTWVEVIHPDLPNALVVK